MAPAVIKRGGALLVSAAAVAVMSGCTVPPVAVTGISIGPDGQPIGVLQGCSQHIDGATVYQTDTDHLGSWGIKPAATGFTTWSLLRGGTGWTVTEPLVAIKPDQTFTLYGWTKDNSSAAIPVDFTAADLVALRPAQVRVWSGKISSHGDVEATLSIEQFKKNACDLVN